MTDLDTIAQDLADLFAKNEWQWGLPVSHVPNQREILKKLTSLVDEAYTMEHGGSVSSGRLCVERSEDGVDVLVCFHVGGLID